MCYGVQNFLLWNGAKKTAKTQPLAPLPRQKKKQKFLDLTERKAQRHSTRFNYSI